MIVLLFVLLNSLSSLSPSTQAKEVEHYLVQKQKNEDATRMKKYLGEKFTNERRFITQCYGLATGDFLQSLPREIFLQGETTPFSTKKSKMRRIQERFLHTKFVKKYLNKFHYERVLPEINQLDIDSLNAGDRFWVLEKGEDGDFEIEHQILVVNKETTFEKEGYRGGFTTKKLSDQIKDLNNRNIIWLSEGVKQEDARIVLLRPTDNTRQFLLHKWEDIIWMMKNESILNKLNEIWNREYRSEISEEDLESQKRKEQNLENQKKYGSFYNFVVEKGYLREVFEKFNLEYNEEDWKSDKKESRLNTEENKKSKVGGMPVLQVSVGDQKFEELLSIAA